MDSFLLPLISLIAGAVLGLCTSIIANAHKQRQVVTNKILDHFFNARKEIVETICVLADIRVAKKIEDDEINSFRQKVSTLYFKNFDFLPQKVLDSILTLNACLASKKGKIYQISNSRIIPIDMNNLSDFLNQAAVYENIKLYSKLAFKGEDKTIKCNLAIKLHAQYVLFVINKYVSTNELIRMTKKLSKTK